MAKVAGTLRVPSAKDRLYQYAPGRTARGACLLLWLSSLAAAQSPPPASPLENPFPEQRPSIYQSTDEQVLPLLPPGIPLAVPYGGAQPAAPQSPPPPATIGDLIFGDNRKTPEDYRSGCFQKLSLVNTYLPRMGTDGFGAYDVELTSVWGLPCPTKDAPLVITPGIANHWLDGPAGLDIPPQLHDIYTEFRWMPKFGERFRADIAVQPGYSSDWDGSSVRAVRITGHGSGIYDWTPTFQLVLGCAYLDRPDIELLPIAGFIWKPDPGVEYRLVFPMPKIAYRVFFDSYTFPMGNRWTSETWIYLAGELGGGTWAIRHSDGSSDLMSYSDWRVYLGMETRTIVGISSQIEIGYVFGRYIRLQSTDSHFDVGDTLMVRAGLNF
jgi:hypothetical protein